MFLGVGMDSNVPADLLHSPVPNAPPLLTYRSQVPVPIAEPMLSSALPLLSVAREISRGTRVFENQSCRRSGAGTSTWCIKATAQDFWTKGEQFS